MKISKGDPSDRESLLVSGKLLSSEFLKRNKCRTSKIMKDQIGILKPIPEIIQSAFPEPNDYNPKIINGLGC